MSRYFSQDPLSERLATYFEEIYTYLVEHNVPEECLPSPWHVLRHITQCVDDDLIHDWLDAYISLESEPLEGEEEPEVTSTKITVPKRRPSYLRPLDGISGASVDSEDPE